MMIIFPRLKYFYPVVLQLLSSSILVSCLYEDQVGKYDWRQQYIGKATHVVLEDADSGTGSPRKLFVAGKTGVLGAIGLRSGQLIWRHILEDQISVDKLLQCGKAGLFSLSGGGQFLRSWSTALGLVEWESTPIESLSDQSKAALACHSTKGSLLALAQQEVIAFSARDGTELWRKPLSGAGFHKDAKKLLLVATKGEADWLVAGVSSGQATVTHLSSSGNVVQSATSAAPWYKQASDCLLVSTSLVCIDKSASALQLLTTAASGFKPILLNQIGVPGAVRAMKAINHNQLALYTTSGDCHLISMESGQPKKLYSFSHVHLLNGVHYKGKDYYISSFLSDSAFDNLEVKVYEAESGKEISSLSSNFALAKHHGSPSEVQGVLFTKKDGSLSYRLLMVTEDYAIQMLQPAGPALWLREEALGTVVAAEMLDLPVSENQAKMEEEFGHSTGGDVISMFVKRITTQMSQLKSFILTQLTRQSQRLSGQGGEGAAPAPAAAVVRESSAQELTRDDFSLQKLVVVSTEAGKLFGLDSATGRPVWKLLLPDAEPAATDGLPIFLQRTTAHFPHPPQASALARKRSSGKAFLYIFNPFTGVPAADAAQPKPLEKALLQAVMMYLPAEEEGEYLHPVLLMDADLRVHLYPANFPLQLDSRPMFLYTARKDNAQLRGYRVAVDPSGLPDRYVAQSVWSVRLGLDQKLVQLAARRGSEHVHSIGRVLGDRSVLYKYLNPNLVAAVTETKSTEQQNHAISVFLVDVVSGQIVFTSQTKRASGPVNVVHSENWLVYSYWNMRARRDEVGVLELFDQGAANLKEFSSLAGSTQPGGPMVLRQAYILPTPAQCLAVSLTEKGITAKSILIMLRTGGLMEMPKAFLDPRRPLEPTADTQEEGVVPYMPELPMSTQNIVNYNQSLPRVRAIHTAPAGLESTSLVFVYGIDLYLTRVMPSKMFDVLKEDFDYFFISVVTIGMVVGSVVTQKLAARKALYRAWQ